MLQGRGEPDQKVIAGLAEQLGAKLDGYERILSKQAYLAGDEITLADLFVSTHLHCSSFL